MADDQSGRASPIAIGALLVANLLPLFGVLLANWTFTTLWMFYWFEGVIVFAWAVVKSAFAQRASTAAFPTGRPWARLRRKRGGFRIVSALPPIYPRNAFFFGFVTPVTALLIWTLFGGTVAFVTGTGGEVIVTEFMTPTIWVAVLIVAIARGLSVRQEYIVRKRYREAHPAGISRGAAAYVLIVLALTIAVAVALDGLVAVVALVGLKLTVDGAGAIVDWDPSRSLTPISRLVRSDAGPGTRAAVSIPRPAGEPDWTVSPDSRAVTLDGLWFGIVNTAVTVGPLTLPVVALVVFVATPLWGIVAFLVIAAPITVGTLLSNYVLYRHLQFERYGGSLIAFDRLLETPQWRIDDGEINEITVTTGVINRLFGLGTVVIDVDRNHEHDDRDATETTPRLGAQTGTVSLRFLADAQSIADALDTRRRTEMRSDR